jgi:outer membrane immunogenic protein
MAADKKDVAVAGLTATVAALAASQAAIAADVIAPEPYVHDWSGVYIGAAAGYVFGGDFPINYDGTYDVDEDFIFGGFAGVNHQFSGSNFVVGFELALQNGFDADAPDTDNDYEVDWIADAKFKLGVAMDEVLLYAFGGVSALSSKAENDSDGFYDYGEGGLNYGLGVDWMVTEQFSFGAEVMGRTIVDSYGGVENGEDDTHWQGMLRAAFHFGG